MYNPTILFSLANENVLNRRQFLAGIGYIFLLIFTTTLIAQEGALVNISIIAAFFLKVILSFGRQRDLAIHWGWAFLHVIPVIDLFFTVYLMVMPGKTNNEPKDFLNT